MLSNYFAIGFNYHHADVSERSYYSISPDQQERIYRQAKEINFPGLCIINTCNRTEIYGWGDINVAIELYCENTLNDAALLGRMMKKTGVCAVEHLFKVASGLDSQIIGDLEILGQFKNAFHAAKKHDLLNGCFERLANHCVQAAKEIRSNTEISGGTISLSYAIVKFLKEKEFSKDIKVLVIGIGEFGKGIVQNLISYLPAGNLYLSNRTPKKAEDIASKLSCNWLDFNSIAGRINDFDVIITAVSNSTDYLVTSDMIFKGKKRLFFDMSVPRAMDPSLNIGDNELITVDDASSLINNNIEKRKSNLPLANEIVSKHLFEFVQWSGVYQKSDSIKSWKNIIVKLSEKCPHMIRLENEEKSKVIGRCMSDFATFIKSNDNLPEEPERVIGNFLTDYHKLFNCINKQDPFEGSTHCTTCSKKF